ncbi:MAG: 4-deoxy-4-formamido-L-arabinose-phosphoundecaprenol deformylase [Deltaproteobacteria bacterium]|nr:4-deoxy-4-formamido-L-arabinose-phosphoundecaprenol deformylase [Deltaproteobacteria bacterium]
MPPNGGIAFKVDIDTYKGLKEGVPVLLDLFRESGIRATFFVSLGPDHSGRAIFQIFRKGFLRKMIRTKAASMYGYRTLLYGTLLPGPKMAAALPEKIRAIESAGHEIGIHCWDHRKWQDRLHRMDSEAVASEFGKARSAFRKVLGREAECCAAPGWITSPGSLAVQDEAGLAYCSDMRGEGPFLPVLEGRTFATLQIPTTLPTMDEILGSEAGTDDEIARYYLSRLVREGLHVMTIHAETEGQGKREVFRAILQGIRERRTLPLGEIARTCMEQEETIPRCRVIYEEIPGRAGRLSLQGERIA